MLSFEYALTKNDYSNYYLFVSWEAPGKQKKRYGYFLRQLMSIFIFTALFYYTGLFNRGKFFSFAALILILLTTIMSVTGIKSSINKQAEKITEDPDNSSFFLPTLLSVSETGILLKDELTERKLQWKAFIKKQENREYYFLFYSAIETIIIPKRIFKDPEKLLFEAILARYLTFDAEIGHLIENK